MSIINKFHKLFRIDVSAAKSDQNEINELIEYSNIAVPYEFIKIIEEKTEMEICVNNKKYIRVWGARGCLEMNKIYNIQKYIPNSLAIGDDECDNVVLYAQGKKGFGVYMVSFNNLDIEDLKYISSSLEAFFIKGEGVDIFNCVW